MLHITRNADVRVGFLNAWYPGYTSPMWTGHFRTFPDILSNEGDKLNVVALMHCCCTYCTHTGPHMHAHVKPIEGSSTGMTCKSTRFPLRTSVIICNSQFTCFLNHVWPWVLGARFVMQSHLKLAHWARRDVPSLLIASTWLNFSCAILGWSGAHTGTYGYLITYARGNHLYSIKIHRKLLSILWNVYLPPSF